MSKQAVVYTYRDGKKLKLQKRPDQFVVRKLPGELSQLNLTGEQMSSASTRVVCDPDQLEDLMAKSRHLAPTHHAYVDESGEEFLITDRVIVTFKKPLTNLQVGEFAGKYALEIVAKFSDEQYLFRLTNDTGMNPVKLVVKLMETDPLVGNAEHDLNMRFKAYIQPPVDPAYSRQWHLHTHFQSAEVDPRSSSRAEEAWELLNGFGNPDVVVAVSDDGCKLDHSDFDSPGKFAGWGYFKGSTLITHASGAANPADMYIPGSNHGTSVCGVIAAETDGQRTVGAAPACRLLPIRWESSGPSLFISDSKLLIALNFIADKADVMSNSWGSSPGSMWSRAVLDKITQLAKTGGRRGKGIVFLWAAGNENCPIQYTAPVDVPYTNGWQYQNGSWKWAGPATARQFAHNLVGVPGVMHVAALASTAQRSHYSNYGPGIDICAPSSNSHAYFRMHVDGLGVTTTTGEGTLETDSFGGTSSATPLAAGIAALVISANPDLTALQVISILKQTASKDLNMAGYPRTPAASYDPDTSWDVSPIAPFDSGAFQEVGNPDGSWSPWFGHGKVDAFAAVQKALNMGGGEENKVVFQASPNLAIPDADPTGVISRVAVAQSGKIQHLKVDVEIEHTYIGDLIVRLVAPTGQRIDLHRREGGSRNNLVATYDNANTPALNSLTGKDITGTWALEVVDLARVDIGTLKDWGMEATVRGSNQLRVESAPGLQIPDNSPEGVTDSLTINNSRVIADINVEVDITHTWIGDLKVALRKAGGPSVLLHNREGREADNIQATYTPANEAALQQFIGLSAKGEWQLQVSDLARRDVGKLNRWALTIR